jgi:hypothetical protein
MIRIIFKDLEESALAKEAVHSRLQATMDRFPDLAGHRLTVTLSMDNSQFKPGPDLFKVKLVIVGKKYGGIILEKSAISLYAALADLSNHALERLNRFGDKQRIKNRTHARKILQTKRIEQKEEFYEENSI